METEDTRQGHRAGDRDMKQGTGLGTEDGDRGHRAESRGGVHKLQEGVEAGVGNTLRSLVASLARCRDQCLPRPPRGPQSQSSAHD